jgi:hypothetical protein
VAEAKIKVRPCFNGPADLTREANSQYPGLGILERLLYRPSSTSPTRVLWLVADFWRILWRRREPRNEAHVIGHGISCTARIQKGY